MRRNQIFRPGAAPRPKLDAARSGRRYFLDMSAMSNGILARRWWRTYPQEWALGA